MNYNHQVRNDGTTTIKAVCAVVLVCFTFLWLYCFQADVMYVAQHVLSGGQTRYHRLWGAVVLTALLWLLQACVYRFVRLRHRTHALTWYPSMMVLAMLTSVNADIDRHVTLGVWVWLAPLLLILWFLFVWIARTVQPFEDNRNFSSLRRFWLNLFIIVLMMTGVAACGNTNAVFHFRTHAEVAMLHGDYDEALRVGERSLETDSSLVMVRMYALSRQGQLADRLFEYPLVPTSDAMLPTQQQATRLMAYPADSLYRHLGAIPRRAMQPMDYLRAILRSGQAKPAAVDYLLCGYLIDCDLDGFASELTHYYTVSDSLPRYYREALVLYNHLRSHPLVVYKDPVLDTDYKDMRKMLATCRQESERRSMLLENYAGSYWHYFLNFKNNS